MRMRQKVGLNVDGAVLKPIHCEVGSRDHFLCWYRLHIMGQILSSVHAVMAADKSHDLCVADVHSSREMGWFDRLLAFFQLF